LGDPRHVRYVEPIAQLAENGAIELYRASKQYDGGDVPPVHIPWGKEKSVATCLGIAERDAVPTCLDKGFAWFHRYGTPPAVKRCSR